MYAKMKNCLSFLACSIVIAGLAACSAANDKFENNQGASNFTISNISILPPTSSVDLTPLAMNVQGRVIERIASNGRAEFKRQWPGTYTEAVFRGDEFYFDVGAGQVILAITVDGSMPVRFSRPQAGTYRFSGLELGDHFVRIQVVNENQDGPTYLGGIYIDSDAIPIDLTHRKRQFEFIGDSHTVGYANTSEKRDCTNNEVWATTNTALGIAGRLSGLHDADYQVNAISGRGIVRNYSGGAGSTMPEQYKYALLSESMKYEFSNWSPELVVVALGTNDFSTELDLSERWATRQDLHDDYSDTYVSFLQSLRSRNPEAFFVVWMAGDENSEPSLASAFVVERLNELGDNRIVFVPVSGLSEQACNWHPNTADAELIVTAINTVYEASILRLTDAE